MLGYGFLNSKVQELCLKIIVDNFFRRSQYFLFFGYAYLSSILDAYAKSNNLSKIEDKQKISDFLKTSEEAKKIFNIFILDEYMLFNKEQGNLNNYNQNGLTIYVLSANITKNKDYNFDSKSTEETQKDGIRNLYGIFIDLLYDLLSITGEQLLAELITAFQQATGIEITTEQIKNLKGTKYPSEPQPPLIQVNIPADLNDQNINNIFIASTDLLLPNLFDMQIKYFKNNYGLVKECYEELNLLGPRNKFVNILNEQIIALYPGEIL